MIDVAVAAGDNVKSCDRSQGQAANGEFVERRRYGRVDTLSLRGRVLVSHVKVIV